MNRLHKLIIAFLVFALTGTFVYAQMFQGQGYVKPSTSGYSVRAYDSSGNDYVEIDHDGTNAVLDTNAGKFDFQDTVNATALQVGGSAINATAVTNPGRSSFTICGEATTINNNTVYYGPDIAIAAGGDGGLTCDINAVGNTTEATADAPVFTNQAFQVLGMVCRNEADANANISYTLRTAAGATVPSVTCTIADGERDCVADVQTTTAIAAGATVAIAAASTGDIADANGFVCKVDIAF